MLCKKAKDDLKEVFVPESPAWRKKVVADSVELITKAAQFESL